MIVDTAGRLHTQTNLMDELAKVRRVIAGRPTARRTRCCSSSTRPPGRTALQQARLFSEAVGVTGVALTKLDGSAKGGVAVAIAYELGLPVKLVGVGEGLDDLRPFDRARLRARARRVMKLVPASSVPLAELAELFTAGYEGYFVPVHVDEPTLAFMVEAWDIDLERSRVAIGEAGAVGFANLGVRGGQGWIGGLGVRVSARRSGVARALMEAVLESAPPDVTSR